MLGRLEAKLLSSAGCADTRLARQQHYAALAGAGILQCGTQQRHFRLPSNENGLVAE